MKHIYKFLLLVFTLVSFFACDKMDSTYEEYVKDGETIYVSKVDSLVIHPGRKRILLTWALGTDPKVKKAKIFWNNGADSLETIIERAPGMNTVEVMVNNLPEGAYTFDLYTFDAKGHKSVKVTGSGNVYGDTYQASIRNRTFKDALITDNVATINWISETQLAYTKLTYTDKFNVTRTITIPPNENQTLIPNFKPRTGFTYSTEYLPELLAIDNFSTGVNVTKNVVFEDVTSAYLKNASQPFTPDLYDGTRWGTLKDWTVNAAAKNQGAPTKIYGGYDNFNGVSFFGLQKVPADPNIANGKVYQTFTLPPGTYEFSWQQGTANGFNNSGTETRLLVAANGATLPDLANINTALASVTFVSKTSAAITFTVPSTRQVSVGVLVNWVTSTQQVIRSAGFKLVDVTTP
ncbi:hypothetical protein HDC92_001316 [Pedobacter sp. AK017]|uniref:DUF4998 domain-containing protein n=1 Tax=Pedobacter sp. AK017 TaxID=2723073 RepID=UPI00160E3517|nr:DUF4998 domain-containing protein [Pedobacter sp. AK017]MBB5437644.1 hypothetical protein [Pedobacter sp. AK017]